MTDPRRFIPRTDELMALPSTVADPIKRRIIAQAQDAARRGELDPCAVTDHVRAQLADAAPHSLRPVLNATGVIVHTNLGRAPLPPAAVDALVDAAGYTDVELDLSTGQRSRDRGAAATAALLAACPGAEDALVVNNGAAALLLACAALAPGREVIISRGELIEIGAGFRLPELIESAHVTLREVGATNRTHLRDYAAAWGPETGAILKVHPSNFRITGFTAAVGVPELREFLDGMENPPALIVDLGSGLLTHDAALPDEPDLHQQLADGADVVIASGDKLLGGPQAGIVLGTRAAIAAIKKHPLARAVRIDKLRLNALEAAISTPSNAVQDALHADVARLKERAEALAARVGGEVVAHDGRVGGGGAPEFPLPGWAVRLPEELAPVLRERRVLPRVHEGACLIDLRCVPESQDAELARRIEEAL
ncbi:L-seryl-tRNA(Sec) selenium transferase [uncultured Corynebacterium sp.]|uniref:L-seryl-tRNA(Sec) selenium transferase n=1 Tax=uncultured Corynebacterium sp. TaxID=159447 RepID=UPI0025D5D99A|nr:L-seryl-tRNA(Sec) selenium transferase [uncultured Corynebacterium sp.]